MIIRRLSELKKAGVWRDFRAPPSLQFARYTLIYGFNGSGKTTFSRVFASIQRGARESRLPDGVEFKVETSDGSVISSENITNPFGKNLLVFNTDFVTRNFQWDDSTTAGIVYLSEKKIDALKEYRQIVDDLSATKKKIKTAEAAKVRSEKNVAEFKTRIARTIREIASSSRYTQSYDARKIQQNYTRETFSSERKLSAEALAIAQEKLTQREPLPKIEVTANLPEGLDSWFAEARELVTRPVSDTVFNGFADHTGMLRWVEEGLVYHDNHDVENCLLCGNYFSSDRRESLRKLFDVSWKKFVSDLVEHVKKGHMFRESLRDLYRKIPRSTEVAPEERERFDEVRAHLESAITQIGVLTTDLIKALEERVANPVKEVVVGVDCQKFEYNSFFSEYTVHEKTFTSCICAHNSAFESFSISQQKAFKDIEAHVLAGNQDEWNRLIRLDENSERDRASALGEERSLLQKEVELRNSLEDHGVGAERMNQLIWAYLGHKEISLSVEGSGYKISRVGGKAATELSEGERTAVSFCYFLTQMAAEGRKAEDLILVIDDPISSLDTAARTYAYSLMTRMTKKCAQVIVLTHNTNFMNMVKREFQNLQKRHEPDKVMALFSLDCRCPSEDGDRVTSLVPMHDLLVRYDSEYHYLFNLVRSAAEKKESDYVFLLPNATRKLLEMFATFCSPGQPNFAGALNDHHDSVKDKLDVRALERLVQIESHGTMEGLGTLPVLTLEEALRAAAAGIKFIQEVGKDHYKRMERACPREVKSV